MQIMRCRYLTLFGIMTKMTKVMLLLSVTLYKILMTYTYLHVVIQLLVTV